MRSSSLRDLASMAKAMDGSGSFTGGYAMLKPFFGQRIAGQRLFQLGHRPDIAGMQLRHRLQVLPWGLLRCASRSAVLRVTFCRLASFLTIPDITLKNVMRPANGSAVVLKT